MGIRNLNKYFKLNVSKKAIQSIKLSEINNKVVAVDTSIYLYKFLKEGNLIEGFEKLLHLFQKNNIIPFFVFDGKPPQEKLEVLHERSREKKHAEQKYKELEKKLKQEAQGLDVKEIQEELEHLRGEFIHIKKSDVKKVKALMDTFHVQYVDAPGEADILLAYLTNSRKAWGILSDDMDFFLYGVDNVLRDLNLEKETVTLYTTKQILKDLKISINNFRDVTILAGTDYNKDDNAKLNLFQVWKLYYEWRNSFAKLSFYEWLDLNKHMKNLNIDKLQNIINSFTLQSNPYYKQFAKMFQSIKITNPWS